MKKELRRNVLLSISVFVGLLSIDFVLPTIILPLNYYFTVLFFLIIYSTQIFILFRFPKTPDRFVLLYNYTTLFKMLFSMMFLISYFLFFSNSIFGKSGIYFLLFFILLYFVYLIINVINFFKNSNEERVTKKCIVVYWCFYRAIINRFFFSNHYYNV